MQCRYCSGLMDTDSSSTVWRIANHLIFTLDILDVMPSFGLIPSIWRPTGVFEATS